jgi:membrane-associated phospholipid phosphatase
LYQVTLTTLYKANRAFFIGFIAFVIVADSILWVYTKEDGFILFNLWHNSFLDYLFIYYTNLGDGFFCVAISLLLFIFKKKYLSLIVFSSYAISGIIAQVLKYFILEARPAVYLKDSAYRYFMEDVTLHNMHAFPSGHTASAFAMAGVLSFAAENKKYSWLFLTLALLVGYSRMYLGQHFLDDVLAGAVLGFLTAVFCWLFFDKIFKGWVVYDRTN